MRARNSSVLVFSASISRQRILTLPSNSLPRKKKGPTSCPLRLGTVDSLSFLHVNTILPAIIPCTCTNCSRETRHQQFCCWAGRTGEPSSQGHFVVSCGRLLKAIANGVVSVEEAHANQWLLAVNTLLVSQYPLV